MSRKKYLFILGSYYPNPSANGICVENIIKSLVEDGHNIYVICEDTSLLNSFDPILINHIQLNLVKTRKINRLRINNKSVQKFISNIIILLHFISWPVTSVSVAKKFEEVAHKICTQENISDVICVINPIESLVAGYNLRKQIDSINLVYYFLDAFFFGKKPRWMISSLYNRMTISFSDKFFSQAQKIVFMKNHKIPHEILDKYKKNIFFLDIPLINENLVLDKNTIQLKYMDDSKIYKVIYVGNFVKKLREPYYFLDYFLELDRLGVEFQLEIYGNLNDFGIDKRYQELSNKKKLVVNGYITHSEAIEKIISADIVVNVGSNNTSFIPSKLFEYFSLRKPILNFSTSKSDPTNEYLKKYGFFYTVIRNEVPKNYEQCLSILDSYRFDLLNCNVSEIFSDNTPQKFISEILTDEECSH
ncbi:hypothetical protein DVX38_09065 [Enterococcus faecium]|uniref:hypothetical protein n=1 Tax=Enterococcus faecium TaxID=1352 RepID=UPI00100DDF4A|nr:hypothetical protein [Enterococcus faecium]RXW34614.1 hypothetical protein CYQ87_12625 [Enterococcus faecium]RXW60239.1 hypothetical protein CYQ72_12635 [Enterococcus faecium]RXW88164.1 hypothetical protein CYQ63_09420 [Enterococcus faecium]TKN99120.1 hypothetical protein DVX38_09065 [Enterococcus faecium]TKO30520.1 hypothetical protein DVX74_09390 [Enterococcus faecium]